MFCGWIFGWFPCQDLLRYKQTYNLKTGVVRSCELRYDMCLVFEISGGWEGFEGRMGNTTLIHSNDDKIEQDI